MPPAILRQWTNLFGIKGAAGFKRGAEEFARLASQYGVERVYVGHIHASAALDFLGVRYVLTGGGGSPLFPSGANHKFYHYLVVRAGPEGLVETVHPLYGPSFVISGATR